MAANPNKRKMIEVLKEKAQDIFKRIKAGDDEAAIASDLGVYPAQLKKFFTLSEEFREPYRKALEEAQEMRNAEARNKKVKKVKGVATAAEKLAMFEAEILDRLREGALIREVARGYEIDAADVSRYFRGNPDRSAAYDEALKEGGHALAEQSVEVTNGIALDLVDAKVMETRSNRLAWLAAKRNDQYDNRQQIKHSGTLVASVSIDIGTGD